MTKLIPFQLSIDSGLSAFRPELEYSCQFLKRSYGLQVSNETGPRLHYGPNPPINSIVNPAVFFPLGVKLSKDGIHPVRHAISAMLAKKSAPYLFPPFMSSIKTYGTNKLPYDSLGLIFFLLSRLEERNPKKTDNYGRFSYSDSFFQQIGGVGKPWADYAARNLAAKLIGTETPQCRTKYTIKLTHDVDRLKAYHHAALPIRYALGDLLKRRQPRTALKTIKNSYFSGEPWTSINKIIALSSKKNLINRFFFMGPSRHKMDSTYALYMPTLTKKVAMSITRRGHIIGFHPGYETATDPSLWRYQRNMLETLLQTELREGRQHVLRYDVAATPSIWSREGMKTDYTMTFPDAPGYRTGTCRAYKAYDLVNRKSLSVDFISTAITDFGLMNKKYQNLTAPAAIEACRPIIQECHEFSGNLCILFHTSNQNVQQNLFYEALLENLL